MKTKEEYYARVLENRTLVADPQLMQCTCPNTLCDWHGKCQECVALHRHHNNHLPACLQPLIEGKVKALAEAVELFTEKKDSHPPEYMRYVKERDIELETR